MFVVKVKSKEESWTSVPESGKFDSVTVLGAATSDVVRNVEPVDTEV